MKCDMDDSSVSSSSIMPPVAQQLQLPPLYKSLVVVLGVLVAIPAAVSYASIHSTLSQMNVCHVGASPSGGNHQPDLPDTTSGTYVPLDDASYYWVKVPYAIRPLLLFSSSSSSSTTFGWSITTLAATVLSPKTRHDREEQFRRDHHHHQGATQSSSTTTTMIQWDQSHTIDPQESSMAQNNLPTFHSYSAAEIPSFTGSSISMQQQQQQQQQQQVQHANRWCLIPGQDERVYKTKKKEMSPTSGDSALLLQQGSFGGDDTDGAGEDSPLGQSVFGPHGSMMEELARAETAKSNVAVEEQSTDSSSSSSSSLAQWRICGPLQPSIMSHHDKPPYFVELPLQPPQSGLWHVLDRTRTTSGDDDDDSTSPSRQEVAHQRQYQGDTAYTTSIQQQLQPPLQHDVQVQCHMSPQALPHLAQGRLGKQQGRNTDKVDLLSRRQTDDNTVKNLWWERAQELKSDWNPFHLPTTFLVCAWLVSSHFGWKQGTRSSLYGANNVVEAMRQHVRHDSCQALLWTISCLYVLGAGLEPILGSISYLAVHVSLVLSMALCSRGRARNYMWTMFALAVLLAQVQPRLSFGPFDVVSMKIFGIMSMNGLPWVIWAGSSILTHTPRRSQRSTRRQGRAKRSNQMDESVESDSQRQTQDTDVNEEVWKYCLGFSLVAGWILSHRMALEVLAAPQWTIPTVLVGHLWWLQRLSRHSKRDESEYLRLLHPDMMDADDSTVFTVDTEAVDDTSLQILHHEQLPRFLGIFASFTEFLAVVLLSIMSLLSFVMLDTWLAIGHALATVLYTGSQYYSHELYDSPRQDYCLLWFLYHKVGAFAILVVDVMTLVGWILCHVLMTVPGDQLSSSAMASIPTFWLVGSLLLVQSLGHFGALLATAMSSQLEWAHNGSPGITFWRHVQVVGEEARLWSYVCS